MTKLLILCVDDEKIVLDSLQDLLKNTFKDKFQIEIAESVEEGWDVINDLNDSISMVLVISDWLMPKVKGDEFLVELHKKYPLTQKILLTGQADPEAIQNAFDNANLFAYIRKPWNNAEIIEKIREALAKINIID